MGHGDPPELHVRSVSISWGAFWWGEVSWPDEVSAHILRCLQETQKTLFPPSHCLAVPDSWLQAEGRAGDKGFVCLNLGELRGEAS